MKRTIIAAIPGLATFMAISIFGVSAIAKNVEMTATGDTPAQVIMSIPTFIDSPGALYQQAEALGLSEEQKRKLVEIRDEAREKALDVLSAEQRKKMEEISNNPMAMWQMCEQMMPMMQKMMGGKGTDGQMMMCPMMGKASASEGSGKKSVK